MSEAEAWVARAWRDGVGPDDHAQLAELGESSTPAFAMFAALARLAVEDRVELPGAVADPAERVVHAALQIGLGVRANERAALEAAVTSLAAALAELAADDPHAPAAHAWADLALGEVALVVGDLRVAHQRFEAVAVPHASPTAIRIDAMRHLVGLAVERGDLEAARSWAAKGVGLAERTDRPIQAAQLRRYAVFLAYAVGDGEGIKSGIADLVGGDPDGARIGRLLLAAQQGDSLAESLEVASVSGDTLLYALCLIVGLRRHLEAGEVEAAVALGEVGVRHLRRVAPDLVPILEQILA